MKFLSLFLALLLTIASSAIAGPIAPADVITKTQSAILKAWADKRDSTKLSGQEKLKALTNDFVTITADKFAEAVPDTNIIVVLGKHQFSYVGDAYSYDAPIVIDKHYLEYTVILFHVGGLTLENDEQPQGSSRGLVFGLCAPDKERKDQWTCRKAKAKEGQKKS